jgi:hypothetical protein
VRLIEEAARAISRRDHDDLEYFPSKQIIDNGMSSTSPVLTVRVGPVARSDMFAGHNENVVCLEKL